jgi:transcriptional regulator with XRE-family HTH domain
MELRQILAENLRALMATRLELNTQTKLHKATQVLDPVTGEVDVPGLTQSTIQRVLAAQVHPTLDTLQRLADAFGVEPGVLIAPPGAALGPVARTTNSVFAQHIADLFDSLPSDQQTQAQAFIACQSALSQIARQHAPQTPAPTPIAKARTALE